MHFAGFADDSSQANDAVHNLEENTAAFQGPGEGNLGDTNEQPLDIGESRLDHGSAAFFVNELAKAIQLNQAPTGEYTIE